MANHVTRRTGAKPPDLVHKMGKCAVSTAAAQPRAKAALIQVMSYGPDSVHEVEVCDPEEVRPLLGKAPVTWVNVDGPVDVTLLGKLGVMFNLHPLALEDVERGQQRAKVEDYGAHHFMVTRMVALGKRLETEQLSLFFGSGFVVTFQEKPGGDCLGPVRERIRKSLGKIRQENSDHLAYAIVDAVIDGYFPVLEEIGERLETLEDEMLTTVNNRTPSRVHEIKRDILTLRRSIWPLREAVNSLCRDASDLVSQETRIYLRDCYDHAVRIIDLVEMYRELCSDLMELHLSSASHRMNEVMKVLTIITTLFIPPTFIAGVYGMNFKGDKSPWNMPELEWFYGYPFALGLMTVVVVGLVLFLRWKGWLTLGSSTPQSRETRSS